ACECHESLLQPASIGLQSSRKSPSRNVPRPVATQAAAPRRPRRLGLSAHQRPIPRATIRAPDTFAASWLYSQGLLAVSAPRYEMSSLAGLNTRGCAISPAIQPALKVTKATRPQRPADRIVLIEQSSAFGDVHQAVRDRE